MSLKWSLKQLLNPAGSFCSVGSVCAEGKSLVHQNAESNVPKSRIWRLPFDREAVCPFGPEDFARVGKFPSLLSAAVIVNDESGTDWKAIA